MEWQPITTAPKDGTRVLLFRAMRTYFVGFWAEEMEEWWDGNTCVRHPEYWMPLPEPPK